MWNNQILVIIGKLFGKTGAPHPDMKLLAEKAKTAMEEADIWKDIINQKSKFNEEQLFQLRLLP